MKQRKVTIRTRVVLLGACLSVFGLTMWRMHVTSDPLTRYPYGTPEERDELSLLLDDGQISTLINMQLQPDQVIPYAKVEDFKMDNIVYYNAIRGAQDADPQFVVYFVNKYRPRMGIDQMISTLSWMPYSDLIDYFESSTSIALFDGDPYAFDGVLNGKTLGRWQPRDLSQVEGDVFLRFDAGQAFTAMQNAARQDGVDLEPISGFLSVDSQQALPEYISFRQGAYGTREEQLGLTVHLQGFDKWNAALSAAQEAQDAKSETFATASSDEEAQSSTENTGQSEDDSSMQNSESAAESKQPSRISERMEQEPPDSEEKRTARMDAALQILDEADKKTISWLENNAWRYGWIVRYPFGQEKTTGMEYQPFVLRYVGEETAKILHDQALTLDEYKAQ